MAVRVNPPPFNQIPNKILQDPELRDYFKSLEYFWFQIWKRTGGGDDLISNTQVGELYPWMATPDQSDASALFSGVSSITSDSESDLGLIGLFPKPTEIKKLEIITVEAGDTAFTTTADQFITCLNTADATVTLNTEPVDGEDALITRKDALVTISGAVNGGTSVKILSKFDTLHCKFSASANEWGVV